MPGPSHQYDRETKAEALALINAGKPAARAARELGLPERSVQIWAKRFREITPEQEAHLHDEQVRLAQRAYELTHTLLDQLEESDEPLAKHGMLLNAIGGTNADKLSQRSSPISVSGPVMILLNAGPGQEGPGQESGHIEEGVVDADYTPQTDTDPGPGQARPEDA